MNYRFSLDKSSKKFICPACQKRRFVRYFDSIRNIHLPEFVGRCDRESSCGYHYIPKQLFNDNPQMKSELFQNYLFQKPKMIIPDKSIPDFINPRLVTQSLKHYSRNHFVIFLRQLFEKDLATKLVQTFQIGTSKRWNGANVFWQIDEDLQTRSGKVMLYNPDTGKRKKQNGKACIDWVHSILKRSNRLKDFNLNQCLFGLHQINTASETSTIGIVESEKTAILMTALLPKTIWMACGSASNLKAALLQPIQQFPIMLYPDLGAFSKWEKQYFDLKQQDYSIQISNLLEKKATETDRKEGLDLADFFIRRDSQTGHALSQHDYPLFWDFKNK